MRNIFVIAKNTFKETIRDRILYAILGFSLLFIISTIFFGSISLGEDTKVIKDLGLAGIYVFSVIITVFLGSSLVYKEIEKKTLYILLTKPVSTLQFVIGKYLGLMGSIVLNILIMTVIYLGVIIFKHGGLDFPSLWSILLLIFELSIFVALTVLLSSFTTPLASTIYSIIVLYIGHSISLVRKAAEKSGAFVKGVAEVVYYVFPNLEKFNIRNSVVYGTIPTVSQVLYPVLYSVIFTAILLWLANITLKKRDI